MNVTVINKSTWSDESIQAITDFLLPCYGDVGMPVQMTIRSKRGGGSWGNAAGPMRRDRRGVLAGHIALNIYIGSPCASYPHAYTYKKTAGTVVTHNLAEDVVHVMAHELRHAEQFGAARYAALDRSDSTEKLSRFWSWFREFERSNYDRGSCEVDAERLAIKLLSAYRYFLERRAA